MIKSFRCKETEKIFWDEKSQKFTPDLHRRAKIKLDILEAAQTKGDLTSPPSNHLEELKGDYKGFMSIRINKQFRLVFRFENGNALDVHISDYH
jgi:proteic killer suppression protein